MISTLEDVWTFPASQGVLNIKGMCVCVCFLLSCPPVRRGLIMGLWNSHTSVGNILGSLIAGYWVSSNWGLSFIVPGLIIAVMGVICFLFLIEREYCLLMIRSSFYEDVVLMAFFSFIRPKWPKIHVCSKVFSSQECEYNCLSLSGSKFSSRFLYTTALPHPPLMYLNRKCINDQEDEYILLRNRNLPWSLSVDFTGGFMRQSLWPSARTQKSQDTHSNT